MEFRRYGPATPTPGRGAQPEGSVRVKRRLSMMSQTAVQDFYQSAHMVCSGRGIFPARGPSRS
jgi:hypothetical protein